MKDNLSKNTLSNEKDLLNSFPKVNRQRRSENEAFMQGVGWLLDHLLSYRFSEQLQIEDKQNNSSVLETAARYVQEIYPDYDPISTPMKRGESSGY